MRPFSFARVEQPQQIGQDSLPPGASYIAGGTTLVDLMKLDVARPTHLADITPLARSDDFGGIRVDSNGARLGALVSMARAAADEQLRRDYPVLVQSLELAASQQLRNMATLGGNVLQRTRCTYFRDTSWSQCNKRSPGSGCAALNGVNRTHAVLGASDSCIATYPGDFAQALMALDASVEIVGSQGTRTVSVAALHVPPGGTPDVETSLQARELIKAFTIPSGPWRRSIYVKVRDRESYEFALASAAVALDLDGDHVRDVRIALGGVATVPWRAAQSEIALRGKQLDETAARNAAEIAFQGAVPRAHNAFKIELGKATLVRALLEAKAMEI